MQVTRYWEAPLLMVNVNDQKLTVRMELNASVHQWLWQLMFTVCLLFCLLTLCQSYMVLIIFAWHFYVLLNCSVLVFCVDGIGDSKSYYICHSMKISSSNIYFQTLKLQMGWAPILSMSKFFSSSELKLLCLCHVDGMCCMQTWIGA